MANTVEKRQFAIHQNIIYSLIQAQAGSMGKAFLEYVMNSIDAGATKVDIKLTPKGFVVTDDGKGFTSKKEIEDWFEVFGFPHEGEEGQRVYGQFGIGRAQMWVFASTVWHTNEFVMDVDVKNRGLDYHLSEVKKPFEGLKIEGTFYDKLLPSEMMTCERELADLAAYAQVPVTLNGKVINKNPKDEKWEHETDEAWIKIRDNGDLSVYNLGVLVRRYPSYQFGCGGIVVTKPDVKLSLNMARNDILLAKCQVWKKIKPFLQSKVDEKIARKTGLTDVERINIFHRLFAGEIGLNEVRSEHKFITTIAKQHLTLEQFSSTTLKISSAPEGSQVGDKVHKSKMALVLHETLLQRLGVSTPFEMVEKMIGGLKIMRSKVKDRYECYAYDRIIHNLEQFDYADFKEVSKTLNNGYALLNEQKELTTEEKCIFRSIKEYSDSLSYIVARSKGEYSSPRKIRVGVSDVAEAWTDASAYIAINRKNLKAGREGIAGFTYLVNLLVHEYLHDDDDASTHVHNFEFYEAYHDITCSQNQYLHSIALKMFNRFIKEMRKEKLDHKILCATLEQADVLAEHYDEEVIGVEAVSDAEVSTN